MAQNIPVSNVVTVTITTSPTFPKRKGFGLLLIIGKSQRLPVKERLRFYSDMDAVAADFADTDEEYIAANVFFSQSPKPTELAIGRRFDVAVAGELECAYTYEKDLTQWQKADGALTIAIDGTVKNLTGVDLSNATTFEQVAASITDAMSAQTMGAKVTFTGSGDSSRFIIQSNTTGASSTVGYATTPSAGTDLGALLGARESDKGVTATGHDPESITDSLQAMQDYDPSWYGFGFTKEIDDTDRKQAAAWAQSRVKVACMTYDDSDVADMDATTDIASFMKSEGYNRVIGVWNPWSPYQAFSVFARGATVDFNGENTTITYKFKTLPGTTPLSISESQRQALVAKNVNYYTAFGDSEMLAEGVMPNGQFIDEVIGLDWLQNAVETNVFGLLYTTTTKIPQTDKGVARLIQQVELACDQGVRNGLLAPGVWNGDSFGTLETGDYLAKGYYIYGQPVAQQNQSDREARKAPPIQGALCGAGAIHFANINLTFQR